MKELILLITESVSKFFEFSAMKAIVGILWAALLGSGSTTALAMVGLLVLIDIITGMIKAAKDGTFSSNKLKNLTLAKIITYGCVLMAAGAVVRVFTGAGNILGYFYIAVQIWIAITEFSSITENLFAITGIRVPSPGQLLDLYNKFTKGSKDDNKNTVTDTAEKDNIIKTTTVTIEEETSASD